MSIINDEISGARRAAPPQAGRRGRGRDFNPMLPSLAILLAFLVVPLALLALFRLAPVVIAIVGSFFSQNLVGDFAFGGLRNYARLFGDPTFWHSIGTTLLFNLIVNPLQVFCAFALAMLTFSPGRGIGLFRSAFFLPMTMSTALTAVLWGLLLDRNLGPVNAVLEAVGIGAQPFFLSESQALWTMIVVATWKSSGYWMIFLLAGLYTIPVELYEAANLDGASWWQKLRYITLPQMRKPLAFVLVSDTAINFLFFAPVYILTKGGPNRATDLLMFRTYESAFIFIDWGRALALSTVLLVIIAIIAAFELRLLQEKEGES